MPSIPHSIIKTQVSQALAEDIGSGDLTAELIPQDNQATAHLICREPAVLCGQDWFDEVFSQLDNSITIQWHANDGDSINNEQRICTISGNARHILTGERSAMNFLQTLSGTATSTQQYVRQLGSTSVKLLDTRKTIPGLREAQKYAVKCGGAYNHRYGLFDGVLIKENHIMAAGSITHAIANARISIPHTLKIEVEVETLEEVTEALNAGADILLLDNMDNNMLEQAIELNHSRALLEVSGNITMERLKELGRLAIDFISTGAITKHVRAVDFSLRFEK